MRPEPLMDHCEFFATQDEAIAHCREANKGLSSADPACCAVVDGPGCAHVPYRGGCHCAEYAVVDLETAQELLAFGGAGLRSPACLIVTK
jgi:hypothetical protein